jgi:hypothetical protein
MAFFQEDSAMRLRLILAAAPLLVTGLSVSAQSMKPGLWEHSFTMKSQSGKMEQGMVELQKQIAAMPPEKRKQMEQMMAQSGVAMGAKVNVVKVCVTPEDAARMDMPKFNDQCKQEVVKFTCTGQPPTSGEGEVTFSSPTAYTSKSIVNTSVEGKPERMTMDQSGKWLAADCGAIKPIKR